MFDSGDTARYNLPCTGKLPMTPGQAVPSPQDAVVSVTVLQAMAHEIRQPLSTIESIAYYLTMVLPQEEEKIREQLRRLSQLVEQSNWILTSGVNLADILPLTAQPTDLGELIDSAVSARNG